MGLGLGLGLGLVPPRLVPSATGRGYQPEARDAAPSIAPPRPRTWRVLGLGVGLGSLTLPLPLTLTITEDPEGDRRWWLEA